jgi:hypothetical protein
VRTIRERVARIKLAATHPPRTWNPDHAARFQKGMDLGVGGASGSAAAAVPAFELPDVASLASAATTGLLSLLVCVPGR